MGKWGEWAEVQHDPGRSEERTVEALPENKIKPKPEIRSTRAQLKLQALDVIRPEQRHTKGPGVNKETQPTTD